MERVRLKPQLQSWALFNKDLQSHSKKAMQFNQHDLASTLAFLTGVPIPRNNIGRIIEPLIDVFGVDEDEKAFAWFYNAAQVAKLIKEDNEKFAECSKAMYSSKVGKAEKAGKVCRKALIEMSVTLSENLIDFGLTSMAIGILLSSLIRNIRLYEFRIPFELVSSRKCESFESGLDLFHRGTTSSHLFPHNDLINPHILAWCGKGQKASFSGLVCPSSVPKVESNRGQVVAFAGHFRLVVVAAEFGISHCSSWRIFGSALLH